MNKETLSFAEACNLLALALAFFNPGESYKTLDIWVLDLPLAFYIVAFDIVPLDEPKLT